MIGLLRKLFWIALFVFFTLVFVTIFEHGWKDVRTFFKDLKTELVAAKDLISKAPEKKPEKGH